MDPRRKKKSGARQWILAAAVAVLAVAVVPLLNYFKELKASRAELPPAPIPKAAAALPSPVPTPVPTQAPRPPQPSLEAIAANQVERGVYDTPLRLAEARAKLDLSDEEHRRLLDDVVDVEHVRAQLEQALVTVESFNGGALELKIPAYPEQGKTLRAALSAQVAQDFPQERAAEITAGFDGEMEDLFCGFGRFSQAFTVTGEDGGTNFHVTFSTTLPSPEETPDAKTAVELDRLTGGAVMTGDGIRYHFEAIGPQIARHFTTSSPQVAPTGAPGSP